MIGEAWYPTAPISTLKYFLAYASKHKSILHQLDLVGELLQANVKQRCTIQVWECSSSRIISEWNNWALDYIGYYKFSQ